MRLIKFLFFTVLFSNQLFAQGISNNWLLGYWRWPLLTPPATSAKAKVDFITGGPIVSPLSTKLIFDRTQGNISDANGNLLMSSNGIFIANSTGDTMQNGGGLNPDPYVMANYPLIGLDIPNGNLFLPMPGDSNKYYLFHESILNNPSCCSGILYYSIIDMNLDGGLGAVTQKNLLLSLPRLSGGIAACKHANGRDWWIIAVQDTSNTLWKILLTPQGITSITSQSFPMNISFRKSQSQTCFSPDGTKFAFTTCMWRPIPKWTNIIRHFNFNRCSGNFSELTSIPIPDTLECNGLSFSPSSKFLYACSKKVIFQINTDSTHIASSIDTIAVNDGFQGGITNLFDLLYLANNGKIYVSTFGGSLYLHTISAPDSAGVLCNVQQHSITIPAYNRASVPNHPNYFLGPEIGSPCDTLLSTKATKKEAISKFHIAPNPVKNEAKVYYEASNAAIRYLEIFNLSGKKIDTIELLQNKSSISINTSSYENGVYFVKLSSSKSPAYFLKIIVLK